MRIIGATNTVTMNYASRLTHYESRDLWLIVPAKHANHAKSRLSSVLAPEQREQLAHQFLRHVLRTARHAWDDAGIAGGIVVSPDPALLSIAVHFDFQPLAERESGLNAAVEQAVWSAVRRGAGAVLVLPTDLPDLMASDIVAMASAGRHGPRVVLAPDWRGRGTNGLLIRPPTKIPFLFGEDSAIRHRAAAEEQGIPCRLVHRRGLAHDLDLPVQVREMALPF